jgi:hypothetical protein
VSPQNRNAPHPDLSKVADLKGAKGVSIRWVKSHGVMHGFSIVTKAPQDGFALSAQDVVDKMRDQMIKAVQFAAQLRALQKKGLSSDLIAQSAAAGVDQGGASATAPAGALRVAGSGCGGTLQRDGHVFLLLRTDAPDPGLVTRPPSVELGVRGRAGVRAATAPRGDVGRPPLLTAGQGSRRRVLRSAYRPRSCRCRPVVRSPAA